MQYKLTMITSSESAEVSLRTKSLIIPETLLTFHWCFSSYSLYPWIWLVNNYNYFKKYVKTILYTFQKIPDLRLLRKSRKYILVALNATQFSVTLLPLDKGKSCFLLSPSSSTMNKHSLFSLESPLSSYLHVIKIDNDTQVYIDCESH